MSLRLFGALLIVPLGLSQCVWADDSTTPKPIPQSRDEEKRALNALRDRQARLPLPPPTEEERKEAAARAAAAGPAASGLGGGLVNNGRMRNLYLPEELRGANNFARQKDPVMTLD